MKTLQRTFTIIKPDAVAKNAVGDIIEQFEKNGFRILAMKMLEISKHQAEQFYAVHASRPWYWRWKRKTPSLICASSWAPPIRRAPRKGRSGRNGLATSSTMPFTG